jgi:hypothetical protein
MIEIRCKHKSLMKVAENGVIGVSFSVSKISGRVVVCQCAIKINETLDGFDKDYKFNEVHK